MARQPIDDAPQEPGHEQPALAPTDRLIGWAADFDDPVAVKARSGGPRAPRGKRLPIAVGVGSLLVVGATVITALLKPFEAESGLSSTDGPRAHNAPPPSSSPTASAEAPRTDTILPEECEGLYGSAMLAEFEREDMHINSVWTGAREAPAGTTDPELQSLLAGKPSLDCFWLDEAGGTESAVLTVASEPGPEVVQSVAARLEALGFAKQNDRGGVRYYVETTTNGETVGESHFVRDGVWLATNWYGFGPWGYTRHMAENVFA